MATKGNLSRFRGSKRRPTTRASKPITKPLNQL